MGEEETVESATMDKSLPSGIRIKKEIKRGGVAKTAKETVVFRWLFEGRDRCKSTV